LFDLPMPHHDSQSCLSQRLNQGTSCVATEDFFNKIVHSRPFARFVFFAIIMSPRGWSL
jgi:hypothetical protein